MKTIEQSRMDNPKTQATLGTIHRQHWVQDTGNIGHKTQATLGTRHRQHWVQNTGNIGHKTQATLGTRHRTKTNKWRKHNTEKLKRWATRTPPKQPSRS
jgi:hypothetical protein